MEPLFRIKFDAVALLRDHPPQFRHPYKAMLFEMAYPQGDSPKGELQVTRWGPQAAEQMVFRRELATDIIPNFYDYQPVSADTASVEWHVNFADPRLFVAYGSGLFAQDEMQVAEHPLLGSVRESLRAQGLQGKTCDKSGGTPILVQNVERRLEVSTQPDADAGRPFGLYGNRFADAEAEVIRRATRRIVPPTISHLIAIAAPSFGQGEYKATEIDFAFTTAFTAFAAARLETKRAAGDVSQTIIHTGFWGCGAFGGNRRMMIALQALAARAAQIDRVILHAGDGPGVQDAQSGLSIAEDLAATCGSDCTLSTLIDHCIQLKLQWGVSDGN